MLMPKIPPLVIPYGANEIDDLQPSPSGGGIKMIG
jgi:hypothetical protein